MKIEELTPLLTRTIKILGMNDGQLYGAVIRKELKNNKLPLMKLEELGLVIVDHAKVPMKFRFYDREVVILTKKGWEIANLIDMIESKLD